MGGVGRAMGWIYVPGWLMRAWNGLTYPPRRQPYSHWRYRPQLPSLSFWFWFRRLAPRAWRGHNFAKL